MNIQISVILWTVICFFILLFILHNLLFKPMLKHLDDRNERILKAKEKQKNDEKYLEDLIINSKKAAQEFKEKARLEAERKVSEEQTAADMEISELKLLEQKKLDDYKAALETEEKVLLGRINDDSDRLVENFVSGFVS